MKALVTGAAGFIGSTLCDSLLASGASVVGLDCFTDYYSRDLKEANIAAALSSRNFRFLEARLEDADLPAVLDGLTHVFHLAAQAGVRKSWGREFHAYTANNIDATQRLLEACVGLPLERVVYASSSSVYGDDAAIPMREDALPRPVSPYGVTKLAAEQLCYLYYVSYRVPTVSMRYFTVYGPRQRPDMAFRRFFEAVRNARSITLYGDGTQTRDFTFVADAVAATVAAGALGVPGRTYNIGGGSRVTMNHVIELVGRVAGTTVTVHHEPTQKGDMRDTYADTTLAARDLGFAPVTTLEQGLAAEWAWLGGGHAHQ